MAFPLVSAKSYPKGKVAVIQPQRSYFVCFTARSGSNLLREALSATGVAGRPEEYLPKDTLSSVAVGQRKAEWRQDWANRPFSECLNNVLRYGTTPNGVFGMKVEAPNLRYLDRMLEGESGVTPVSLPARLEATFPNLRYVWVTRRNKVRQAVSFFRAAQTDAWRSVLSQSIPNNELTFNLQLVDQYLRQILREEAAWSEYFTTNGIVPYTVVYEDLAQDYERIVRGVLEYLQISLPEQYQFSAPRLQKQADELSEDWVQRYQEGIKRRHTYQRLVNLPLLLRSPALRRAFFTPQLLARQKKVRRGVTNALSRTSGG